MTRSAAVPCTSRVKSTYIISYLGPVIRAVVGVVGQCMAVRIVTRVEVNDLIVVDTFTGVVTILDQAPFALRCFDGRVSGRVT